MYSLDDTIAAIATSIGQSGVGIVKISGPDAPDIAKKLFHSAKSVDLQPYRLHYGTLEIPVPMKQLTRRWWYYMPKPHSYTRQDVIEIQAHGGIVSLQRILEVVLSLGRSTCGGGRANPASLYQWPPGFGPGRSRTGHYRG